MRQALYALAAAALGFAAALFLQEQRDTPQPAVGAGPLALQVNMLSAQVDRLSRQVERLALRPVKPQEVVSAVNQQPDAVLDFQGLDARVAELEARQVSQSLQASADHYRQQMQYDRDRAGATVGEALFSDEPEVENAHYRDVVSGVFSDLGGQLDLQDVACRGSVCRVRYGSADGAKGGDVPAPTGGDELLSALMSGFEVSRLEMHHGRDESGNSVVYIRIP